MWQAGAEAQQPDQCCLDVLELKFIVMCVLLYYLNTYQCGNGFRIHNFTIPIIIIYKFAHIYNILQITFSSNYVI